MTSSTTTGAMASGADAVVILYTNYRGETAVRRIVPRKRHPIVGPNDVMWFGTNDYHKGADDKPEPQWFITAEDVDRSPSVMRDFALSGIKAWGQEAVDAALAAPAPVVPEELRALSEAATQGDRWAVGDDEKSLCVVRNGNLEEVGEALPWDARFLIAAAEWVRTAAAGAEHLKSGPAPEAMLAALDRFTLRPSMRDVEPREDDTWLVIDTTSADPETNWPGELVSEHSTHHEARISLMSAVIAAATPSKPVGDGPEASAPPAGGGADLRMLQQAAKAGRLRIECRERLDGADPDAGMTWPIEVELPCINGLPAWFTLGNIYSPDRAAQGYTDGALNDDLARSFAAHIVKSLAAPAAPEPAAGGEREIAIDILTMQTTRGPDYFVRIRCGDREVTPHVFRERYKAEYEAAHYAWIFGLRADEPDLMAYDEASHPDTPETIKARPVLSAPSGAETAGGETIETIAQWCEDTFGPITPERIATRANEEMVELLAEPSKVEEAADVVIVLSRYPDLWDAIERKMKVNRARRWRFMGDGTGYHVKDEPTPANAGAEGGQA